MMKFIAMMKEINDKQLIHRALLYNSGLLILAFGIVITINSGLGVSPVSSLPYVVSLASGVSLGVCIAVIFSSSILIQVAMLGKEFKYIRLSQIVISSMFGYFVTFASSVIGDFTMPTYAGQLCMLAIGIMLLACGLAMSVEAKFINMPAEELVLVTAYKFQTAFHRAKIVWDCAIVALSITISLVFLGELQGVREGTVIAALAVGKLMPVMRKIIAPAIRAIGFNMNMNGEHLQQ